MPFCPKCGCEYEHGVLACSDDGEPLVKDLPFDPGQAPDPSGNMVEVYSTSAQVEAGLIKEMLESEGIVVGMSNQVGSLMLQYAPPLAGLRIFVHERDEAQARELIESIFENGGIEETEEPVEPEPLAAPTALAPPPNQTGIFIATLWTWCYFGLGFIGLIFFPAYFQLFFNLETPASLAINIASSLVTIGTIIYFFVHIKRNPRLSGVEKGLWALGLINLAVIFLPVYLFRHIGKDSMEIQPEGIRPI